MTLYKVTCLGCDFYCGTDSHLEAIRVKTHHYNFNSDDKTPAGARIHLPKLTASAHAVHHGRQIILDDLVGVAA